MNEEKMLIIIIIIICSLNLVLALGSRDEIKDQIFIKRFGRRCGPSSVIYFKSIKNINLLYKKKYNKKCIWIFLH